MKKKYSFLFLIVVIAAFLRFQQLGQNPPSLTWDEVAWGYNAYSIGIDGRDEFGKFLPIQYLESFGDFKPPMYAYLTVLPVKLFGLNEFAVRFPSAMLGTLTVLITYFLVKILFNNHRTAQNHTRNYTELVASLSALFLAISPWHINLSRAAFEANVATFFIVTGVWLFLYGINKKEWLLALSAVSFVASLYTFNTARVVSPLIVLVLAVGFRKLLVNMKKQVAIAVIIGMILAYPFIQFMLMPQAKLRYHEVNIFSDIGIIERTNREIANDGNAWWSRVLHNRRGAFAVQYVRHYFDHFNPSFLFIKGDGNPKFSTQDVGQVYLWDLPFLISGVLFLLRRKEWNWWIVPAWLFLGIVPAATARETPHALRIETTLPTFQILVAIGVAEFLLWCKRVQGIKAMKFFIIMLTFSFLFINFAYYFHGYYVHYPRIYSGEWQYGYKEAIAYIQQQRKGFDRIYFTEAIGRPYVYFLFYTQFDPRRFRKEAVIEREVFGFVHVKGFDIYRFEKNVSPAVNESGRILFVDIPTQVPPSARVEKTFYLLNGDPALVAYTR